MLVAAATRTTCTLAGTIPPSARPSRRKAAGALHIRCTPLDTACMTPDMGPASASPKAMDKVMRLGTDLIIPRLGIRTSSRRHHRLIIMPPHKWARTASIRIGKTRIRIISCSRRRRQRRMCRRICGTVTFIRIKNSLFNGELWSFAPDRE